MTRRCRSVRGLGAALVSVTLLALLAGVSSASAAGVWWHLTSGSAPTNLVPGQKGQLFATAVNPGSEDAKASPSHPIRISDRVPAGLELVPGTVHAYIGIPRNPGATLPCKEEGQLISCLLQSNLAPYGGIEMVASVKVSAVPAAELPNEVKVEGGEGGVPSASRTLTLKANSSPTPFGTERYEFLPENEDGSIDTQAGSHPYQLTTTFNLNEVLETNANSKREEGAAPALVRDLHFILPPGLLGNVTVVPQCSGGDFATIAEGDTNLCPAKTALGVARVTVSEPNTFGGVITETVPVWNLEPAAGEPARFGIELDKVPIYLNTAVRTGKDYAVEVSTVTTSETVGVLQTQLSFWGTPGDPRHDAARGWECVDNKRYAEVVKKPCLPLGEGKPNPFLTLPTTCTGVPRTTVSGDSWPHGGEVSTLEGEYTFSSPFDGCNLLGFTPSLSVEPDTHSANTPAGMTVKVHVPQESTLSATGLAEGDIKSTTVALPEGVQASAGAANGLLACSASQAGFTGFGEGLPEGAQLDNAHFTPGEVECPEPAKIGTVKIKTPLLKNELEGSVYLASQDTNPFGSPLVLYLIAFDPVSGVRVKLAGSVAINQANGQLVSTFSNTPPVPFEELTLNLFGGSRASQATPSLCGAYGTQASFEPWTGGPTVPGSSTFAITSGVGGGPCPSNPLPFGPSFQAGSMTNQSASFTGFSLNIGHADSDQALSVLSMQLPPGLAAMLSSITPCPEPQAAQGTCGPESLIGHSTASSGLGGSPFTLGGSVYLTGPYKGAPFGILVVTPAVAGPFNLGNVDVRSTINVDRTTAAVSITSDPFPTMIKGVPTQIKQINVTVDRPGFQFNPTNCKPMSITGTLTGAQGGSVPVSSPFQVGNCAKLPFAPKLSASVIGQASKANGADLTVKVDSAGFGQAGIEKVRLTLPIQLPSRLDTIQKACRDTIFEVNPASCQEGSVIGRATIHTPVLKNPLSGPAYLVSHANRSFPDVVFVLQGEGITLVLDGNTDIKKGITYSRFESTPDAPFTTFLTELPAGPHSALGANLPESANRNFCGTSLVIPTEIVGQNGAVIKQTTKVAITRCHGVKGFKESSLNKALRACRKIKNKAKRVSCEAKARKKYAHKASRRKKRH